MLKCLSRKRKGNRYVQLRCNILRGLLAEARDIALHNTGTGTFDQNVLETHPLIPRHDKAHFESEQERHDAGSVFSAHLKQQFGAKNN